MKSVILAIIIALGINTVADAAQYVIRYQNGRWNVVVVPDYPQPCPYHPYAPVYPAPVYPVYPHYYHPPQPRPCPPKPRPDHRHDRKPHRHRGCN